MSAARVLDIIVAAASALAAAHSAGLVHRDVKPGNLLLGRDGSIKIVDFGIARAVDAVPLTRTGIVMGTPLYLSPEQATGMSATAASDLYALGVIAYELLVGRPPYEGPPTAVLLAHRDTPLPPLPPSVPSGLGDLVRALTAKDPALRPETATAVVGWADRLRADRAMTVMDEPLPDGGVLPSAITPIDQPMRAAEPEPRLTQVLDRPLAEPSRRRALPYVVGGLVIVLIAGIVGWFALPAAQQRPVEVQGRSPTPAVSPAPTRTAPPAGNDNLATHAPPRQQKKDDHDKHHGHGGHKH
jgi:serine/threonine-protein kinase